MKIGKFKIYFSGLSKSYDFVLGISFNFHWMNIEYRFPKSKASIIIISILLWSTELHIEQ